MHSPRKNRRVELGPGTGIIGSLMDDKGYGFIINHNQELDDLFFHFSEYPVSSTIISGTEISFVCVQNSGTGKYKAQNIKITKQSCNNHTTSATYKGNGLRTHHNNHHNRKFSINNNNINTMSRNESNVFNQTTAHQIDNDMPKLGCFKLVKKDVTNEKMYIPVFPLQGIWKSRKQFV